MIEVRIPCTCMVDYSTWGALNAYIEGKLIAAGFPISPGPEIKLLRKGTLECAGPDPASNCEIWRWYEEGELEQEILH